MRYFNKWLKRARILLRLVLYKLGLDKRPVFGVLTVTSSCDFRCKYCFADYYIKREPDLTTERMFKTIDELADFGVIYLNVHGGEALLRKDIGQIIDYAVGKGMFVNLITNGTLLVRRWEDVKRIDSICISLDGRQENNDKNRGEGTFRIASNAIDFALSQGVVVRIGMTITKHTMNDLEWVAEFAGKKKIYIQPFLLFDQESLPRELWMTPEENRQALRKLIELKKKGYPIFYSFKTLNYALNWPYDRPIIRNRDLNNIELKKNFRFIPCYYKLLNVLIESNGTVRPCNILARSDSHISILDKSVRQAKEELLTIDDCLYCYHLPQMEFSQLMALDTLAVLGQFFNQIKEEINTIWAKGRNLVNPANKALHES